MKLYTNLILLILLLLGACGKTRNPHDEELMQNFSMKYKGYYRASFITLNQNLSWKVSGGASIFVNDIQFYAKVKLSTAWKEVTHLQMIHEGSECPTMIDDMNNDGYLDGLETISAVGKILIPLDYDLKTQFNKFYVYPVSNEKGNYLYSLSASSSEVIRDLREKDIQKMDFLGKIGQDEELKLNEKVIVIYGVPRNTKLPFSIKSFQGFPNHMSLPIACGKIFETADVFP